MLYIMYTRKANLLACIPGGFPLEMSRMDKFHQDYYYYYLHTEKCISVRVYKSHSARGKCIKITATICNTVLVMDRITATATAVNRMLV